MADTEIRIDPPPQATKTPAPPPLAPLAFARWIWRQLTSMRTALMLLFLLALAAVPGSVIPQRSINPIEVANFVRAHPTLSVWYGRLGLFDVFSSPWFSAIYLLLVASLVGCVLPRARQYLQTVRRRPPGAPRRLSRLHEHRVWRTDADVETVLAAARAVLRGRHYRVAVDTVDPRGDPGTGSVAAERGYLREVGNLVFHFAILVVLVGVAIGSLFGFKGTVLVVAGDGFSDLVTQYDGYSQGQLFHEQDLPPFTFTLKKFTVTFQRTGAQRGAARDFDALLGYVPRPGAPEQDYHLRVNHPLSVDGTLVHLIGHGYAPVFTIRDGAGHVAFAGPVPFLPQDGNLSSTGVVKVPDARPKGLALAGLFLPTAAVEPQIGPVSVFPQALDPAVYLTAYSGNLGLDNGVPQSVYALDTKGLTQLTAPNGSPFSVALVPGQTAKLPDGLGTVTLDGWDRWANLQVSRRPATDLVLLGAILAIAGLLGSLFVRRRRAWVRAGPQAGRTVVEVAGLDRSEGGDLSAEIDELVRSLRLRLPDAGEPSAGGDPAAEKDDRPAAEPAVEEAQT